MTDGRDFCNDVAQSLLEFPSNFRLEEIGKDVEATA